MKKIALTSLMAVFAVSAANAATNYFVGGSAAIETDKNHASVMGIAPEFGWNYNSNWDFGLGANFAYDHRNVGYDEYDYGAYAFARYKVAQFGGVKLLLKGMAGVDFTTIDPDAAGVDSETMTSIGAGIIPMITYDISESFTLYANLNFLGVYAGYDFKNDDAAAWGIGTLGREDWGFGFGVDADNVANTTNFQIGFTYNF